MNEDKQWVMLEDKILYAQWTANIYICTFDANGGTTPIPETFERIYEQKIADTISGFPATTRKGYEFAGWYTAAEGGVKLSEVSIMPDMDVTYYAQWTPNAYIIGTDDYPTLKAAIDSVADGGSATIVVIQDVVDPSEAIVPSNKTITINTNGNTITKTVYTIVNDGSLSIIGGGRIIAGGSYAVTLNANNGTGGTESVIAIWKTEMPSAIMPTRSGYTFQGYYDDITGGTQYYTETGESARLWDKEENITLYARWTENT